jgi:hypothetical protein
MAKAIKPGDLGAAIAQELTIYNNNVIEGVNEAGKKAIKKLVRLTEETAPIGERNGRNFAASISSKEIKAQRGNKYVWYVKPPNHRLTHLLVHGHATKDGGRTKPNPFLQNAVDTVLPEFEKDVEEAVKQ